MTTSVSTTPASKALGATWIVAALPTGVLALLFFALSEGRTDRTVGLVLALLAVSGLALGAWLLGPGRDRAPALSYALSAVWAVTAIALYPTQDFSADALWVAGLPLVGAVATALVAWRSARR